MSNDLSIYTGANDDFANMRQSDVIMPRVQLQQATSKGVVDGKFKMGQYIDMSQELPVIDINKVGSIIPLIYWLEWIEWNPDRAAPKDKRVLARSLDPQSSLAKMAGEYVKIDTPQGPRLRVTEYYHFIALIPSYSGNYEDMFMISFSKSSHMTGKAWLNKLRKAKIKVGDALVQAPIWANEWEISATREQKDGNTFAKAVIGASKMAPIEHHATLKMLRDMMHAKRAEIMEKNAADKDEGEAHNDTGPVEHPNTNNM